MERTQLSPRGGRPSWEEVESDGQSSADTKDKGAAASRRGVSRPSVGGGQEKPVNRAQWQCGLRPAAGLLLCEPRNTQTGACRLHPERELCPQGTCRRWSEL